MVPDCHAHCPGVRSDRFLPDVSFLPSASGDACGYDAGGRGRNGGQVECQAGACPYSLRAGGRELDVQQFPFLCFGRHSVHGYAHRAECCGAAAAVRGYQLERHRQKSDWGVLLLFGGGITLSSILVQTGARDSWRTRYLLSPWGRAPSSSCSSSASSSRR